MKLSQVMKNPRLKVRRANSHIESIIQDSSPLSGELHEITQERMRTEALPTQPNRINITYRPKAPVDEHFGAIMGDAVNNLRESLEYWMNNAVQCVGPKKKLYFPFASEWKGLKSQPNYQNVESVFPEAAAFIHKEIKPCRDSNLYLWAATSLCNDNKHKDFIPVVSVTEVKNLNARLGGAFNIDGNVIGGDANRSFGILTVPIGSEIQTNFETNVEIIFAKGAVFEGQPVVPTLEKMSEVVSQTLDKLEDFIAPHCK